MKFTIPGNPIAMQRPRFTKRGFAYDPQSKEKEVAKLQIIKELQRLQSIPDPQIAKNLQELAAASFFRIELTYHTPPPSSSPQNANLWGFDFPTKKDLDNFVKATCDILNGLLYKDDRAIVEIYAKKVFSSNPRTEIDIMPKKPFSCAEKTENFLKIFGPDELICFLKDIHHLKNNYNFQTNITEMSDVQKLHYLTDISNDVTLFAEKYADALKQIKKKSVAKL